MLVHSNVDVLVEGAAKRHHLREFPNRAPNVGFQVRNYEHWKYVQEICDMMHSRGGGRKITKLPISVLCLIRR
jgi:uncharacterized protein (DUF779 family)